MHLLSTGVSPFLVLWYLFIAFLGAVLLMNVIFAVSARVVRWRLAVLVVKHSVKNDDQK